MPDLTIHTNIIDNKQINDNFFKRIFSIWDIVIAYILFVLCLYLFNKMYAVQVDQALHLDFMFNKMDINKMFLQITYNSFMQWLVYVFGLGNKTLMYQALPFVLSLAFVTKYFVIRWINTDFIRLYNLDFKNDGMLRLCACLISFSFPIFTYIQLTISSWYRGLAPQCVWHNPTIVIVLPFALALFWASFKFLTLKTFNSFALTFILIILNFFLKPVFLMPFLPVFFFFFLFFEIDKNGSFSFSISKGKVLFCVIAAVPILVVIYYLYNRLFGTFGIEISLFKGLSNHNNNYNFLPNIKFVMIRMFGITDANLCYLFAFAAMAFFLRLFLMNAFYFSTLFTLKKKIVFLNLFAFLVWVLGLIIAISVYEIDRPGKENFLWHFIACNNIILVIGSNNFICCCSDNMKSSKYVISMVPFAFLFLQASCGFLYVLRIVLKGIWY